MILISGAFDPFHAGHADYLRQACGLLLPYERLVCAVASDAEVLAKHAVVQRQSGRDAMVRTVLEGMLDPERVSVTSDAVLTVLRDGDVRLYVKGMDWYGALPQEQVDACTVYGIGVVFVQSTPAMSSTALVEAVRA